MDNLLTHRLTSEYLLYDAGLFLHVYMQARFLAHACMHTLVSYPDPNVTRLLIDYIIAVMQSTRSCVTLGLGTRLCMLTGLMSKSLP